MPTDIQALHRVASLVGAWVELCKDEFEELAALLLDDRDRLARRVELAEALVASFYEDDPWGGPRTTLSPASTRALAAFDSERGEG